jgi:outer membrane receptor protein involved in Fe transport
MDQNIRYYLRRTPRITVVLGLVLVIGTQAYADVVGRLHFVVKNAADDKVIPKASIVITDPAGVVSPVSLTTDDKGEATTPPLPARAWTVKTKADTFDIDSRSANVVADTTTDVEILMDPLKEQVIKVSGSKNLTKPSDANQSTSRTPEALNGIPLSQGNAQSLKGLLMTVPGMASDSVGQLHPDGEHSSTSIYLNGFQLPGAFQGRFGQILGPNAIQNLDVLTGGYAPEYGRETAAILNVDLRSGTIEPFLDYSLTGGSYGTFEGGLTFGGQLGREYGLPDDKGKKARVFSYLVSLDSRQTQNALEPPQPDDQTAHNAGQSWIGFGNFDYHLNSKESLSLTVSDNPANTEVANRTGLPAYYANLGVGQGYGYGGAQNASSGLASQQADGQDDYQVDHNEFGVLSYLRDVNSKTQVRLSFGLIHNGLDVLNNNPAVNLSALPADNSIEFNPTLIRNSRDAQGQGSITSAIAAHTVKFGFTIDRQTGLESYQLTPASQAALNVLLSGDPTNSTPISNLDTNPLYPLRPGPNGPTTIGVQRQGWYNAAYLQDTWKLTHAFTANYGLRLDDFLSDQTTTSTLDPTTEGHVGLQMLEPRVNLAYALPGRIVLRGSYNRLMIIPPSAQGAAIGQVVPPERINQYDFSVEKQTGPGESVKARAYLKEINDQLDTGLLVPGTQMGIFISDSIPKDSVRGIELSYNLFPTRPYGLSGYASFANALAKTEDYTQPYNDHDQLNTISAGASYKTKHGESAGFDVNYGSGFDSSTVNPATGLRTPHSQVDLQLASAPNFPYKNATLVLAIQNVLDDRTVLNFNSGFSGTRFEQGRRILLTVNGHL